MTRPDDRALGMHRRIRRRDFLNGASMAITASLLPPPHEALLRGGSPQQDPGYYPPALTGMRGSHAGSFEVAHALRDGEAWAAAVDSGKATTWSPWVAASPGWQRRMRFADPRGQAPAS